MLLNMFQEINITEEDICYAERILLPEGKVFDNERRAFIRNMLTIDLQAVPGSGKTTALLAKLLILERYLPFIDGSGILVISHTNAAIDEIKHKILKHCPKLFSYPNYIGTIQGFVDEFLAVPLCNFKFKTKINWIDTERYQKELSRLFDIIAWDKNFEQPTKWFYQRHIGRALEQAGTDSNLGKEICKKLISDEVSGLYYDFIKDEIKNRNDNVLLKTVVNKKFQGIKQIILEVIDKGIISYDYAYHLGQYYLHLYPEISNILQMRFPLVFVDEMQDMDKHQYELLEKVFVKDDQGMSIMQRIGDKNQSIFSSVNSTEVWIDRAEVLRLSGSQRLSKPIADVVKKFALYSGAKFDIVGLNDCNIKPHILVFTDETINNVLPQFGKIIKSFRENGSLRDNKNAVEVICWNTEWKEQSDADNLLKLRLVDYYPKFKKDNVVIKETHPSLKSYLLFYDKKKLTLEPIRKNILNSLVHLLHIEKVETLDGMFYTKKKIIDYLKNKDLEFYETFMLKIYEWSINIVRGTVIETWHEIQKFIPEFFAFFSQRQLSSSLSFINSDIDGTLNESEIIKEISNKYVYEDIEMGISSIHSVKGQTHSATLYLESFYQGGYESDRPSNQFLGLTFNDKRVHHKSSTKMAYVGLSRPTNLLCVAIHANRFRANMSALDEDEWEIMHV